MGDREVCEALQAALPELPLFPLGTTVFFPHTLLPLHIFEPRYRQMTEVALETHKMIAIVPCGTDEELERVAGVGRIVHHERLDDGRYHILLQGLARVEILEEHPMGELLFRRARTELYLSDDDDTQAALASLKSCYDQVATVAPVVHDTLREVIAKVQDPGVLADVVCAASLEDPSARLEALRERRVSRRLQLATEGLADLLLRHAPEAEVVH